MLARRVPNRLRVLHITPEFPPVIWGGLGTAVGGLVTASAQAKITTGVLLVGGVLVVGEGGAGNERSYGLPGASPELRAIARSKMVANLAGATFFHVAPEDAIETGVAVAREWQPDIIHLHTAWMWPVARAIREQRGTPVVFTVHSLDRAEYEVGGLVNRWEIQETVIFEADLLIALSDSERDLLVHYCPGARSRIRVVGNGIDDCEAARESARRYRREGAPIVLYSGRFVDRKGIRELLEAIPMVLSRVPETRFVLVGGYGGGAEIERAWLLDALRPYSSQVQFTGWLAPREVAEWYRRADVLVVPSWYEPFGMVILEGMLYGLSIASSDVGGPAHILENERTGLLFPPRDAGALARTLVRLVTDPDLRHRIGAAAANEVRRRWLWPQIVRRMQAVYREANPAWPDGRSQRDL